MKRVLLLIIALCVAINLLPADDNATVTVVGDKVSYNHNGLSATFDKNILLQSTTLKDMIGNPRNLDNENVIKYATTELFKDIDNQHHMDLLINALQNNSADLNDPTNPSPQTIQFVDSINKDDLVWLTNATDFWAIDPLFEALIQKLAGLIASKQNIDTSQLNQWFKYRINKHIDFFWLKMSIGNMLKYDIPYILLPKKQRPISNVPFEAILQILYVYISEKKLILYDPFVKRIVSAIMLTSSKIEGSNHTPDVSRILADFKNIQTYWWNATSMSNLSVSRCFNESDNNYFEAIKDSLRFVFDAKDKNSILFLYNRRNRNQNPITVNTNSRQRFTDHVPTGLYILIKTDKEAMLYPTLSNLDFQNFDPNVIQFLTEASHQWRNNQQYTIKTPHEMDIYRSLPHLLQSDRLFNIPALQITKAQRIKDYLARVAHTVYKWFGWRGGDMDTSLWRSWQSEHALDMKEIMKKETQQSKEDEKEEDI